MLPAESTGKGGKTIFPGRLERFYQWDAILRDLKSVEPADYIGEAYGIWSFDQRNGGRTQTLIISCARIDFLPTMVFQVRQFQSSIRCLIISFSFFLKSPIASWLILLLNWTSIQSFSSLILNNISIAQILNLSENVTASFVRVDEHSKIEIPIFSNFQNIYKKKKEKKRNGSINFPGGKLNLIIDKNERIGRREEAEGAAAKPKRGTSASTLRIVSVWTPITRFTPSPASSSSRSPRARLFLPFKKKLAEPASRSQLARCLYRYYRLAWNGMSRKGGKKRAIPGWGQTGRLIIINGDDRQFPRYFLRFLIFRPNREGII